MTIIPFSRYRGTSQPNATDNDGKTFFALQGPDDSARLVMIDLHGIAHDVTPIEAAAEKGRPELDASRPWLGLWFVGNKAAAENEAPRRYPVKEWVCCAKPGGSTARPPVVLAPTAAVWQFVPGAYTAAQLDTAGEIAALLTLHKNALAELRNALVIQGVIVKG